MAMKNLLSRLRNRVQDFRASRDGNIAIIFALSAFPVIGLVGASIDYSRANMVRSDLQSALDATALMVSKTAATQTSAQLTASAQAYFATMFNRPEAGTVTIAASYTTTGGSAVTVTGSTTIQPQFIGIVPGLNHSLAINSSSTVNWGTSRLRVALVLDNTGSMADSGKITALKTATKNLLTQLRNAATNNGDVYVSIVPFSKDVNVGTSNVNASWIDWTSWNAINGTATTSSTMTGSICYGGTLYRVNGSNWTTGGNCTGLASGVCYNGSLYQWNGSSFYVAGTCNSSTAHSNWNGCVTDRGPSGTSPGTSTYDQTISPPVAGTTNSLYPAEQYSACTVAMMPLNYDWTTMNSLVDSMQPNGYTNQPIGLVWGWLTLAGGGVFTVPTMDSGYTYNQVIILLSDGLNTEDRWYVTQSQVDTRMYNSTTGAGTCANIKAAGITIYTIQVNTGGDPTSTLMQNCASDPSKFFLLTSSNQIVTTFNTIGTNLSQLRVAR